MGRMKTVAEMMIDHAMKTLVDYWQQHQVVPHWAAPYLPGTTHKATIDDVIRSNEILASKGKTKDDGHPMAMNTLYILRSARARGELVTKLEEMTRSAWCKEHAPRRLAFCKKWHARIRPTPPAPPKCCACKGSGDCQDCGGSGLNPDRDNGHACHDCLGSGDCPDCRDE
jgi:hypothetical protein